jgi:hypothetical protein
MTQTTGSWPFTAFSNAENYSKFVIQGFRDASEAQGDASLGYYDGNAKNRMLRSYGDDSNYIEKGNLAVISSHGNIYGVNVEYSPVSGEKLVADFEWGNNGVLQWVLIDGCEMLGFAKGPDGKPAANARGWWGEDLSALRWNGAFAGISGMCGYRSMSWYVPGFVSELSPWIDKGPRLGYAKGKLTRDLLSAGHTFPSAWTRSADWIHRNLRRGADVTIYASHPECLGDTLTTFASDRRMGVDLNSVISAIVGAGPPEYDYPTTVDADGNPTASAPAKLAAPADHEVVRGGEEMPVFAYSETAGSGPAEGSDPAMSDHGLRKLADGATAAEVAESLAANEKQHGIAFSAGEQLRSLEVNGDLLPILFDAGFRSYETAGESLIHASSVAITRVTNESRRLPTSRDVAAALQHPALAQSVIEAVTIDTVYVKSGEGNSGRLIPAVQANVVASEAGVKRAMVLVL